MPPARLALSRALATAVVVLVGCGGDDNEAASTTTQTGATTERTTASGVTLNASVGPGSSAA